MADDLEDHAPASADNDGVAITRAHHTRGSLLAVETFFPVKPIGHDGAVDHVPHDPMFKDIVDNYRTMFESRISAGATEKLPCSDNLCISSWSFDMEDHAKKCVERYCELANRTTQQLYKGSTPCIDDHHFKEEELKSVGDLSKVCSQIVLKCLYLARIGRPDILWSVNKIARSITKWTKACDKRLSRLISYVPHTCVYKQYCHVEILSNNAGWDCFKILTWREILRIQNPHQVEHCAFSEVIFLFQ